MFSTSHHHYVPVLKLKRGEADALRALTPATKGSLTPLIEMVPIPTDLDTGDEKETLEEHVDPDIAKLVTAWGTKDAFFLDPGEVAAAMSATMMAGAEYVFSEAQGQGLLFIPVTGVSRTSVEQAAALKHKTRGICLRISQDDLVRSSTLATEITTFLNANALKEANVDLVIDLGSIIGQTAFVISAASNLALSLMPSLTSWRSVTVVASAFPADMGVVPTFASKTIERTEWISWLSLHAARAKMVRLPTYGDYGIQNPAGADGFDPRYMQVAATIRYTLDQEWLLIKGQSTKTQGGSVQFPRLAKQLIGHASYYGAKHCSGCKEVDDCAKGGRRQRVA
jgi:hypothetical protein